MLIFSCLDEIIFEKLTKMFSIVNDFEKIDENFEKFVIVDKILILCDEDSSISFDSKEVRFIYFQSCCCFVLFKLINFKSQNFKFANPYYGGLKIH